MPAAICLLFYALLHKWWWISFCAEESPEGCTEAGKVCTMWALIWYWIGQSKEGRLFSICRWCWVRKLNETHLYPLAPLWLGLENKASFCNQCSGVQRLTLTVPFSSNGQSDDLMNHTFQGALWCPYFLFVSSQCVSEFSLRTLTLSCGISVESKTVFSSLCLWMWQSRGACMCNMVLTFGSLLGRDNHSRFIFSRAMGGLSSKDGYLQIPFSNCIFYSPLILITYAYFL